MLKRLITNLTHSRQLALQDKNVHSGEPTLCVTSATVSHEIVLLLCLK